MILDTNDSLSLTSINNQIVVCMRIEKECDDCQFLKVCKLAQEKI